MERPPWELLVEEGIVTKEELELLSVHNGDRVRLKFLYPNGQIEIVDCIWISIARVDEAEGAIQKEWLIVKQNGKVLWKPLTYLVQIEILRPNEGVRKRAADQLKKASQEGYHS